MVSAAEPASLVNTAIQKVNSGLRVPVSLCSFIEHVVAFLHLTHPQEAMSRRKKQSKANGQRQTAYR